MQMKVDYLEGFFDSVVDWHELGTQCRVDGGKLTIVSGHDRNPAAVGDEFACSGDFIWLSLFENAAGAVNRVPIFIGCGSEAE